MGSNPLGHDEVPRQLRRERLLDMERRLARSRRSCFAVLALMLALSGPWIGWWTLLPLAGAGIAFGVADRLLVNSARPDRWAAIGWGVSPIMIGLSVALTGGPESPAISWFALPAATLAARFETRGVLVGLAYTLSVMLATTFALDPSTVWGNPPMVLGPMALTVAIVILSTAVVESDRDHRRDAVIDQLTGLLNRSALAQRFDELEHGRRSNDTAPFAILLGDLDHFKSVNDEHGHAVGDAVLRDAAYAMRSSLRALDLVYRVGGEEFLAILPDAEAEEAADVAERVRVAVEGCSKPGISVTMSFGVASSKGTDGDPARLFSQADVALYKAKRAGRNRVEVASPGEPAAAAV